MPVLMVLSLALSCSCCGHIRLVEIKCPFTAENQTIREAMAARKIPFLDENNDTIELSKTSRGYYAQVQCAMAVTQLLTCDFVVWSRRECIVLEVPFDSEYWDDLIKKLC